MSSSNTPATPIASNPTMTLEEKFAALEAKLTGVVDQVETVASKVEGYVPVVEGVADVATAAFPAVHDRVTMIEQILAGVSNEMKAILGGRAAQASQVQAADVTDTGTVKVGGGAIQF